MIDGVVIGLQLGAMVLLLIAAVTCLRFDDALIRLQAAGKVGTLGLVLLLLAAAVRLANWDAGIRVAVIIVLTFLGASTAAQLIGHQSKPTADGPERADV